MKNKQRGVYLILVLLACILVLLSFVFLRHLEADYRIMTVELGMDINYSASLVAYSMLFTSLVVLGGLLFNNRIFNIAALLFLMCHLGVIYYYYYSRYGEMTTQSQKLYSFIHHSFIHAFNRYPEHILQTLISIVLSGIVLFKLLKSDK